MNTRSPVFEAIRAARSDQKFTADEVAAIDATLDTLGVPRIGKGDWLPFALSLIKQFEGCRLAAYPDPGSGDDPWTIGWGSTGAGIVKGLSWTQAQADARLAEDVARFGAGVLKLANGPANQIGAMVSFAYNVGLANLASSTLLKKHLVSDVKGAAAEFARWDKAGGKVMAGLTRRRSAEARVYQGLPA